MIESAVSNGDLVPVEPDSKAIVKVLRKWGWKGNKKAETPITDELIAVFEKGS